MSRFYLYLNKGIVKIADPDLFIITNYIKLLVCNYPSSVRTNYLQFVFKTKVFHNVKGRRLGES